MLLRQLPPESAFRTAKVNELSDEELYEIAQRPPEGHTGWSHTDMVLAAVFDAIQLLIHVQLRRRGADAGTPPSPLRRPGVPPAPDATTNPQAIAYLERIRAIHQAEVDAAAAQT
jgi:hypothetical protein